MKNILTLLLVLFTVFFIISCPGDDDDDDDDDNNVTTFTCLAGSITDGHNTIEYQNNYYISGEVQDKVTLFKISQTGNLVYSSTVDLAGRGFFVDEIDGQINVLGVGCSELTYDHLTICNFTSDGYLNERYSIFCENMYSFPLLHSVFNDGNYLWGSNSLKAVNLYKTDTVGNIIWHKNHIEDQSIYIKDITATSDGGIALTGSCSQDLYLMKFDEDGNKAWDIMYPEDKNQHGYAIIQCNNNFVIAGEDADQIFIACINNQGELLWKKRFDHGFNVERPNDIICTKDGYFAVTGTKIDSDYDIFLSLFNPDGEEIWTRYFGGEDRDEGYKLIATSDGGYAILGRSDSYQYFDSLILIKTDENGYQ